MRDANFAYTERSGRLRFDRSPISAGSQFPISAGRDEVGPEVGPLVGPEVGPEVGPLVGPEVGPEVGLLVGPNVGLECERGNGYRYIAYNYCRSARAGTASLISFEAEWRYLCTRSTVLYKLQWKYKYCTIRDISTVISRVGVHSRVVL